MAPKRITKKRAAKEDAARQSLTPAQVFTERLRGVRKAKRLSQRALVERLADQHGLELPHQAIVEIENGRRRVSIDEVFAIAAALNVAPLHLLTPHDDHTWMRVGETHMPGGLARSWMRGEQGSLFADDDASALNYYLGEELVPAEHRGELEERFALLERAWDVYPDASPELREDIRKRLGGGFPEWLILKIQSERKEES